MEYVPGEGTATVRRGGVLMFPLRTWLVAVALVSVAAAAMRARYAWNRASRFSLVASNHFQVMDHSTW
jgi:hypothetical protein